MPDPIELAYKALDWRMANPDQAMLLAYVLMAVVAFGLLAIVSPLLPKEPA